MFHPNIVLGLGIDKASTTANLDLCRAVNKYWPNCISIYTDASKLYDHGCVRLSVWIPNYKIIISFELPLFSRARHWLFWRYWIILTLTIFIFSDSKSSLQALSNQLRSKIKFPIILKIKHKLHRLFVKDVQVSLAWIPSHMGIRENETADQYAKDATR